MKYYTIYKTINLINNMIYIGKHETKDIDDIYFGSGTYLLNAINKYGKKHFKKEILYIFESKEEMDAMEAEIVDEVFISRLDTYNIICGGTGGFSFVNEQLKNNPDYADWRSKKMSALHKLGKFKYDNFKGKKHTEESKKKIGKANSISQKGSKNSQYGKAWIYNLEEKKSIRVPKEEVDQWIEKGWIRGRKQKF